MHHRAPTTRPPRIPMKKTFNLLRCDSIVVDVVVVVVEKSRSVKTNVTKQATHYKCKWGVSQSND